MAGYVAVEMREAETETSAAASKPEAEAEVDRTAEDIASEEWGCRDVVGMVIMSIALTGWNLAVAFISFWVARCELQSLYVFPFLCTHGGAEIQCVQQLTREFITAAEKLVQAPELSQNLDSMTATWRSRGLSWVLLLWCALYGLVVTLILLAGAWLPALLEFRWSRAVISVLLTPLWGYVGWMWLSALRTIRRTMARVTITSTFDRLTIEENGLLFKRDTELLIFGLTVRARGTHLRLRSGEQVVSVYCAPGPQRKKLIATIRQSVDQANADPPSPPELLQAPDEEQAALLDGGQEV